MLLYAGLFRYRANDAASAWSSSLSSYAPASGLLERVDLGPRVQRHVLHPPLARVELIEAQRLRQQRALFRLDQQAPRLLLDGQFQRAL
jgi:hypothetical protein